MQEPSDILIADDEEHIASFIADVLRDEGYSVRVVHDGASALLAIASHRPGLAILDVAMPVMVGDELLRYLRRNDFADLPVIIMTAGLYPERYLSCGANEVLSKPFDVDSLLDKVASFLPPPHQSHELGKG